MVLDDVQFIFGEILGSQASRASRKFHIFSVSLKKIGMGLTQRETF